MILCQIHRQFSRHRNKTCYTMLSRCAWHILWGQAHGFQSYAPFSKFLYNHIVKFCVKLLPKNSSYLNAPSYTWSVWRVNVYNIFCVRPETTGVLESWPLFLKFVICSVKTIIEIHAHKGVNSWQNKKSEHAEFSIFSKEALDEIPCKVSINGPYLHISFIQRRWSNSFEIKVQK